MHVLLLKKRLTEPAQSYQDLQLDSILKVTTANLSKEADLFFQISF